MKIRVQGPVDWNLDVTSLQTLNLVPHSEARAEPLALVTRVISGLKVLALEHNPVRLNLPGNSVRVERGVKDVTGAAKVCAKTFFHSQGMILNGF